MNRSLERAKHLANGYAWWRREAWRGWSFGSCVVGIEPGSVGWLSGLFGAWQAHFCSLHSS